MSDSPAKNPDHGRDPGKKRRNDGKQQPSELDDALDKTFPASDPPAQTQPKPEDDTREPDKAGKKHER